MLLQFFQCFQLLILGFVLTAYGEDTYFETPCTKVENCRSCENRGLECIGCSNKQTLNADKRGCSPCPMDCAECHDTGNGNIVCDLCDSGYGLDAAQLCKQCPGNCATCDSNMACTSCDPYYGLIPRNVNSACIPFHDNNCETWIGSTNECASCTEGYRLESGRCIPCGLPDCEVCDMDVSLCDKCTIGFTWHQNYNYLPCILCDDPACDNCDPDQTYCLICRVSYYLNNGFCYPCNDVTHDVEHCQMCPDSMTCDECVKGYFLDPAQQLCIACDDPTRGVHNCVVCSFMSSNFHCVQCKPGYLVDIGKTTCHSYTGDNCEVASFSNVCAVCNAGSILLQGLCYDCDPNCSPMECTYHNSNVMCGRCEPGYMVNADFGCDACPFGCEMCNLNSDVLSCDSCIPGHAHVTGTCGDCPRYCQKCDYRFGEMVCLVCDDFYVLDVDQNRCLQCPFNCAKCDTDMACITCDPNFGFIPINVHGVCIRCPILCVRCELSSTGEVECIQCSVGFALAVDRQTCTDCGSLTNINSCIKCTDADAAGLSACQACFDGYALSTYTNECTVCSTLTSIARCSKCSTDGEIGRVSCLECDQGYAISDDFTQCRACSIFTDCGVCEDSGWECVAASCQDGFILSEDKRCERPPEFYNVWPNVGPQAGGTVLTISGSNIPTNKNIEIYIGQLVCAVQYINSTIVEVVTPELADDMSHLLGSYLDGLVLFNNAEVFRVPSVFTYKGNPAITDVHPKESIIKGGTQLTVEGENFESVAVITMVTTMILKTLISIQPLEYNATTSVYRTICEVTNQSKMLCPTPQLDIPDGFTTGPVTTRKKRQNSDSALQLSNGNSTLEFYIGFVLDGVEGYQNYSALDIYVEPTLKLDPETVSEFVEEQRLTFPGENLDKGVTVCDYRVTVGTDLCEKVELISNIISCLPPQTKPDVIDNSLHPTIVINIGINIAHGAGYLRYPDPTKYYIIAPAIVLALIVLTLCVISGVCIRRCTCSHRSSQAKHFEQGENCHHSNQECQDMTDSQATNPPYIEMQGLKQ